MEELFEDPGGSRYAAALEPVLTVFFFLMTKSRSGDLPPSFVLLVIPGWYGEYAVGGLFDEADVI